MASPKIVDVNRVAGNVLVVFSDDSVFCFDPESLYAQGDKRIAVPEEDADDVPHSSFGI